MKRPHFALPEIYDDSLSYYDVLRKLIKSMHVIEDNLNKIPEQIANEAKTRLLGDQNLQTNIDNEKQSREQADQEIREGVSNKISELKGDLAGICSSIGIEPIYITDISTGYEKHGGLIDQNTGKWMRLNESVHEHTVVPIPRDGGTMAITVSNQSGAMLYFSAVSEYTPPTDDGQDAHVIQNYAQYKNGIEYTYDIPDGTKYIIFETKFFDQVIYFDGFSIYIPGTDGSFVKRTNVAILEDKPNEIFIGGIKYIPAVSSRLQTISMGDNACTVEQAGCVAIGVDALKSVKPSDGEGNDRGYFNTAVGNGAMSANTTGNHNTAVGWGALGSNITGSHNTCVGEDAGCTVKEGGNNTCIGGRAFQRGLGNNNTAIGQLSMFDHSTGSGNTYVGHASGNITNDTGWYNTGIGDTAICPDTRYSVAVGAYSKATKNNQVVLGCDGSQKSEARTSETLVFGNLVVSGTDGIKRQIIFNDDGTCTWIAV